MMQTRPFRPEDHEEVSRWWKAHGWVPMPLPFLPDGLIVEGRAVGFLYEIKGMPAGWIELCVANPDNTAIESFEATDAVVKGLINMARMRGIKIVQAFLKGTGIQQLYAANGFVIGEECREMSLATGV